MAGRRRIEGDTERVFSVIDRMDPGTLRGGVKSAAPVAIPPNPKREIIPRLHPIKAETAIHWLGQLTAVPSPAIYVKTTRLLAGLLLYCTQVGGTATVVSVLKNGVTQASGLTLPAADPVQTVTFVPVTFLGGIDYLNVVVTSAGSGVLDFIADPLWETVP